MADRLLDFGVSFEGTERVSAKLGLAADRVGDLRPVWDAIHGGRNSDPLLTGGGYSFITAMARQFKSKGTRSGSRWAAYDNEPRYRAIKIKFGGGLGNILRWTPGRERLYPSLISGRHPEHVYKPERHSVVMGTAVPYARRLHFGIGRTKFDGVPLKARPIVTMTRQDFRVWVRAIQRHVAGTAGIASARASQLSRKA